MLEVLDYSGASVALLGAIENDIAFAPAFESPDAMIEPGSLPAGLRVDVALIRPLRGDDQRRISMILARLRDVHAVRILLYPDQLEAADVSDFVALGFEPQESPSIDGLVYVWDPDLAEQPREWNNPSNWANPENFSKFRW